MKSTPGRVKTLPGVIFFTQKADHVIMAQMWIIQKNGFTLIELMIVIAVIAILAAIAIPGLISAQRSANETSAASSLRTIAVAENDFKASDADGNGQKDYWTGDVAGLYYMSRTNDTHKKPLKIIEQGLAGADAQPITTPPPEYQPRGVSPQPRSGYWLYALSNDLSDSQVNAYRVDTDGSTFACRNISRFGFLAFPDSLSSGRNAIIINEAIVIYKRSLEANIRTATALPPGPPTNAIYRDWPQEAHLGNLWKKVD